LTGTEQVTVAVPVNPANEATETVTMPVLPGRMVIGFGDTDIVIGEPTVRVSSALAGEPGPLMLATNGNDPMVFAVYT